MRVSGYGSSYVSLQEQLPAEQRDIDDLRYATAVGEMACFSDEEKILIWRDRKFTVIPFRTAPYALGARLHGVGEDLYVTALGHPLLRLTGDRLEPVVDDPVLRENQIIAVEAGGTPGTLVLLTAEHGFFQLAGGRVEPLPAEANRWLAGRRIFRALRLPDGSRVVAFSAASGDGGMRFDAEGHYAGPLDMSIGLVVKTIRGFFRDREGGLWLGTEAGAARLEWPSAASVFDVANGLGQGAVADVVRHEGILYAATSEGIFRLSPADDTGRMARFERLSNRPAHALVSTPEGLLALGYSDLLLLGPTGFTPVLHLPSDSGTLLRSKRDPARVWIGTALGLHAVRHTPDGWRDEGHVPGVEESCRGLSEAADGTLWVATAERGFLHIDLEKGLAAPRVERFVGGRGLPEAVKRVHVADWAGEPAFVLDGSPQVFRFDAAQARFAPWLHRGSLPAEGVGENVLAATAATSGWVASATAIWELPAGGAPRRLPHLVLATAGSPARVFEEETGPGGSVLWVAGARGLVRVEVARAFVAPVPFTTYLDATGVARGARLEPEHAPIGFSFLAPRQRPTSAILYQTRLDGYDRGWSAWEAKRERTFPRLSPGRYRFEVRARDADGVIAEPATLAFVVVPPWWRTWWALLGYAAAATGVVTGIVRRRTRALRRRAAQLEAIIAERTAELAQKNTELTRLHRLEFDEKVAARLAEEKARLEVLRYQLNPHFLFNTLASISAALPTGRNSARAMVERLADFCRLTLHRADDHEWTTLGEEMKLLRAYFDIEQTRWGDLLDIVVTCDEGLAAEPLPHFLLLPLVENALKYGHATSPDRVGFRLAARRESDGALVFEVANTGEWVEPGAAKPARSLGIGLDNLRERLKRYYPRIHQLDVAHANGWVIVTLRLAVQRRPGEAGAPPPSVLAV